MCESREGISGRSEATGMRKTMPGSRTESLARGMIGRVMGRVADGAMFVLFGK